MAKAKKEKSTEETKETKEKKEIPHAQEKGSFFNVMVYPEYGIEQFCKLCNKEHLEYCYIMHDKSLDDKGNQKKLHWHCMVKMPVGMQSRISAVSKLLNIPDNLINVVKYKYINDNLAYFCHLGTIKEKYEPELLKGNLKELAEWKECFYDTGLKSYTEKEALAMAYNFIIESDTKSIRDLMLFAIDNDIAKQLKPYFGILGRMITEDK